jgi:gliding motility-associated-like protein
MRPMKNFLPAIALLIFHVAEAQNQACPLNNDWSFGNLTHWQAYTGNNLNGNPASTVLYYDSSQGAPNGTLGVRSIQEYQLPSVNGIQVITANSTDPYGAFPTIPKVNSYQYRQTIKLGSTSITHSSDGSSAGGYVRGVSYLINVPPGPTTEPYTMTYAYAMVLENGTHNSNEQPLFKATLKVGDSVITCASPSYFLPTYGSRQNIGAVLDSAAAKAAGFYPSKLASPNPNPNGGGPNAPHLYDVWAKRWTEVTFDLGPYRGRQVSLTFETDNCVPGGHFAYSYIALRNICGGLEINGDSVACQGITLTYSVPALGGATYQWQVPPDWSIVSGADSSVLQVKVGTDPGTVKANEQNSCANLTATLPVITALPTIAGALNGSTEVCTGTNSATLTLTGARGGVLTWLASTNNGATYTAVGDTTYTYTATNLTDTTLFRALVQNGESCAIDTAAPAVVDVDPKSVGGSVSPASMLFCLAQTKDALLTLGGNVGKPTNWQSSPDAATWTDFAPPNPDSTWEVDAGLASDTYYRVTVQSGVCPPASSSPAVVNIVNTLFPQMTYDPADTVICYNTPASLNGNITVGTSYAWHYSQPLTGVPNSGTISPLPYSFQATATPLTTTNYILNVTNAGCPNDLIDTFHIVVLQPILVTVSGYPDTSIVIGQPLQLSAFSNDSTQGGDSFTWTPSTGLDNPNIYDPVALFTEGMDSVRYFVTATNKLGCKGTTDVLVKVFSTGPNIFVPNAFTPGGPSNNVFRPIPVGIEKLDYFRVYNRWGQLVYATTTMGEGWDGRLNGQVMDSGTYVWLVQGVSYTGKIVYHKGTMVLIR